MVKTCPVCGKIITRRAFMCGACYDTYGGEKDKWPEWLRYLIRDYERERMSERRWVRRMKPLTALAEVKGSDTYLLAGKMNKKQKHIWAQVVERDQRRCLLCGRPASEVHHVAARSWFGKNNKDECWQLKNMLCLCKHCHSDWQHTSAARKAALELLHQIYGYEYEGQPWQSILNA